MALMLASLLLMVLVNYYAHAKRHYYQIQQHVAEQVDLFLVSELMRTSVRRAGFTPCASVERLVTADRRHGDLPLVALINTPSSIQMNHMHERFNTVLGIQNKTRILITKDSAIKQGRTMMIADCYHAELHPVDQVTRVANEQVITLSAPLMFDYQDPVYVGEWLEERYFIQVNHDGHTGLFYRVSHAEELTPMVHALTAHVMKDENRSWVRLQLELDKVRRWDLETMVRSN